MVSNIRQPVDSSHTGKNVPVNGGDEAIDGADWGGLLRMLPVALIAMVKTPMTGKHAPVVSTAVTTKVFLDIQSHKRSWLSRDFQKRVRIGLAQNERHFDDALAWWIRSLSICL